MQYKQTIEKLWGQKGRMLPFLTLILIIAIIAGSQFAKAGNTATPPGNDVVGIIDEGGNEQAKDTPAVIGSGIILDVGKSTNTTNIFSTVAMSVFDRATVQTGNTYVKYLSGPNTVCADPNGKLIICPGPTTYQCNDGIDNDGDGIIDFPADPGCTDATDDDESDTPIQNISGIIRSINAHTVGITLNTPAPEPVTFQIISRFEVSGFTDTAYSDIAIAKGFSSGTDSPFGGGPLVVYECSQSTDTVLKRYVKQEGNVLYTLEVDLSCN